MTVCSAGVGVATSTAAERDYELLPHPS